MIYRQTDTTEIIYPPLRGWSIKNMHVIMRNKTHERVVIQYKQAKHVECDIR